MEKDGSIIVDGVKLFPETFHDMFKGKDVHFGEDGQILVEMTKQDVEDSIRVWQDLSFLSAQPISEQQRRRNNNLNIMPLVDFIHFGQAPHDDTPLTC